MFAYFWLASPLRKFAVVQSSAFNMFKAHELERMSMLLSVFLLLLLLVQALLRVIPPKVAPTVWLEPIRHGGKLRSALLRLCGGIFRSQVALLGLASGS